MGFWQEIKADFGSVKAKLESAAGAFVSKDVFELAVDSVSWAETAITGDLEKRNEAKAKFIADAKTAGHDLKALGESQLNLLIEIAVQLVTARAAA